MSGRDRLRSLRERLAAFEGSPRGRLALRIVRGLVVAAIVGFLVWQFSRIGWSEVWASMPTQPLFYVLLVAMYLLLPLSEGFIYSRLWGLPVRTCWMPSLKKRVLNRDVLGYSGEVYLYLWARARVALPRRQVLFMLKDNLILSSVGSVTSASLLLTGFIVTDQLRLADFLPRADALYLALGLFVVALVVSAAVRFRRVLFHISGALIATLLGVHVARFVAGWVFQIWQWSIVVPEAPFQSWAVLLSVLVLTNRIPLLPSGDLVFVGLGTSLATYIGVPAADIAAMLIVRSAFEKGMNLLTFVLGNLGRRAGTPPEFGPDEALDEAADLEAALLADPAVPLDGEDDPLSGRV